MNNVKTYLITNFLMLFIIGLFGYQFFSYTASLKLEMNILQVQYNAIACQLSGDYVVTNFVQNKKTRTHKPPEVQEDNGKLNYLKDN